MQDRNGVTLARNMFVEFVPSTATPPVLRRLTKLGLDSAKPVRVRIEHVVHAEGHDPALANHDLVIAGQREQIPFDEDGKLIHCGCRHCRRTLVDDNYRHDFAGASETLEVELKLPRGKNAVGQQSFEVWTFHVLPAIVEAKGTVPPKLPA